MRDGTIERDGQQVRFRYQRRLQHPVDRVWTAITDPAELERWTGNRPEIDLRPGGEYVVHHGNDMRVVDHVLRVEPPTLFKHTFWVEVNPSARVNWHLSPVENDCLLVLTHTMSEDDIRNATATVALGDHPVVIMSRNAAGWHRILDRIECYLDQRTDTWSPEDQAELQQHYAALLSKQPPGGPVST